jgi:S-(hydroxymethyl)glutathione dehydrogenase/alcohol dehydrogenase
VVQSVGAGVPSVEPGDRVVLNWAIPCGCCFQCRDGHPVLCEASRPAYVLERSAGHARPEGTLWNGQPIDRSFNLGTLSGLALVREAAVTRLPEAIPFASACIMGCGVMTGYGSVMNVAKVPAGAVVAVVGCGGVGLNVIQAARLAGARVIAAIDSRETALENAEKFGATHVFAMPPGDPDGAAAVPWLKSLSDGRGADFAFEATSAAALVFLPLQLVRNGGMALQVSGCNETVAVPMPQFMWNKFYVTPLYGDCLPSRDFPRMFQHYENGGLRLDELVTRQYPLEEVGAAVDDMMSGRNAKGVIVFPGA